MHLTMLTLGTRGDVQPMIALGRGLREAGHRVCVATHDNFAPLVAAHGLDFRALAGDPGRIMRADAPPGAAQEGTLARFRHVGAVMSRMMREAVVNARDICHGTDAIIANTVAHFIGEDAASAARKPWILALLQPAMKSRSIPSVLAPEWPRGIPGRGLYNELTYAATDVAVWALMRPTVNAARRSVGLPDLRESPIGAHRRRGAPMIVGVSEHVVPPPDEPRPHYHTTGFWFLPSAGDYSPPPELSAFLDSGPPPLCIGFGSAGGEEVTARYRMTVDMARRNRWRTLLLTGWGQTDGAALPDHVLALPEAPHDWLLPRVSAFVHHGGAGTTAAALRAGVPAVIVPFGADARFWARRVHDLGAGPLPFGLGAPADRVEAAIREALESPHLRAAAQAVATRLRAEDGTARAVEIIERTLGAKAERAAPRVAADRSAPVRFAEPS